MSKTASRVTVFETLSACVETALVKRGLALRLGNKELDDKTKAGLNAMMTAIISVAHYVGVSDDHYRELKRLADKVRHRPQGMCERNEERLAQFSDKRALRAIVNLPFHLAERLSLVSKPTVRQAQEMQMVVLLAILLYLPVRIKNAAALDLDIHIKRPVGGVAGRWTVRFTPNEVKNNKSIDGDFNEEVSARLGGGDGLFRARCVSSR